MPRTKIHPHAELLIIDKLHHKRPNHPAASAPRAKSYHGIIIKSWAPITNILINIIIIDWNWSAKREGKTTTKHPLHNTSQVHSERRWCVCLYAHSWPLQQWRRCGVFAAVSVRRRCDVKWKTHPTPRSKTIEPLQQHIPRLLPPSSADTHTQHTQGATKWEREWERKWITNVRLILQR